MKRSLNELNEFLFAALERLDEENITPEKLDLEVKRTAAIVDTADQIVKANLLQIRAAELANEYGADPTRYLVAIESKRDDV